MTRRLLLAIASLILGLAGSVHTGAVALAPAPAYAYDAAHHASVPTATASERGPPAAYEPAATDDAVDRWSHGASACSGEAIPHAATCYDDATTLVEVAQATGPTGDQVRRSEAELSSPDRARVATKTGATVGHAASTNYRATFFAANPGLEGKVVVHHAVEQQVLKRYPGLFTEAQIHSLENLRVIPIGTNSALHLSQIRRSWNTFLPEQSHANAGGRLESRDRS